LESGDQSSDRTGYHAGFVAANSNNPRIVYLWKALQGDVDMLKLFTTELPDGVFAESTSRRNNATNEHSGKGSRKPGGGKGKRKSSPGAGGSTGMATVAEAVSEGMNVKNVSLAVKHLNEARGIIYDRIKSADKEHIKQYNSFLKHCNGDKATAKERIQAVKKRAKTNGSLHSFDYDSDANESDDSFEPDSQEDQIKSMLRAREEWDTARQDMKKIESKLKSLD
jgi:hypothetical protein